MVRVCNAGLGSWILAKKVLLWLRRSNKKDPRFEYHDPREFSIAELVASCTWVKSRDQTADPMRSTNVRLNWAHATKANHGEFVINAIQRSKSICM